MDTKLCRICGKLSENYVHIFKTEGLKNKIETCLPIIVSPHCLLPDTICSECLENVDNFYSFIKNCLQNIIVLEAQYDIMESCLKTKRKHEKSCITEGPTRYDKNVQTDDDFVELFFHKNSTQYAQMQKLHAAITNADNILKGKEPERVVDGGRQCSFALVSYEIDSDAEFSENEKNTGEVILLRGKEKHEFKPAKPTSYFDDVENDLIDEIVQRKSLKRKSETILPHRTKIFKMTSSNRRKSRPPVKVVDRCDGVPALTFNSLEKICREIEKNNVKTGTAECPQPEQPLNVKQEEMQNMLQLCLLCDVQCLGPTTLARHVYDVHGIDMAQVMSSEPVPERKKKLPNLVKIADLKNKNDGQENGKELEGPPTLQPTFVCPLCPAVLTNRSDLFVHLKVKHPKQAALMCGVCLHAASSSTNLATHVQLCRQSHNLTCRFVCKVCAYQDDNPKTLENHVAVHEFVLAVCKKQIKMFDPCDYVDLNPSCESNGKTFTCTECNQTGFVTFKEFSAHRRSQHQIFHCDLCNKFYGRNSHLWKHVNRLHKGHPSITCQLCYKTSASKYHLSQHFNKIHSAKPFRKQSDEPGDNFMAQKFQGFDFQSVRQSFMKQELLEQERKPLTSDYGNSDVEESVANDDNRKDESKTEEPSDLDGYEQEEERETDVKKSVFPPKEIDTSSDLYTNIITNYTPPQNEGEFKCPKCFKGFHKKTLLKKHKKNCRPRLQKDLLTRCKTCSRIFKDRQSLTKHLVNYHSEYACEICGQKVQSKCEIVSHIRFSHPKCHLFCHCGNILRSKADLAEHKRDHRNSFVCQFCADMLPTKIKLKMHILSLHRKILSLSCGICLKLFETQHILRDHVRLVHKNELSPMTSCTVCGKNYGSKWKTYDHLNKSHGRIFRACKACLDVFNTEDELQVHFEANHIGASHANNKTHAAVSNATASFPSDSIKYDSDLEEDNEEKNPSSDLSNDADVYHADYVVKTEPNLSEDEATAPFLKEEQDIRLSLLEKRLTNRKFREEPENDEKQKGLEIDKKNKCNNETKTSKPNAVIKREYDDVDSSSANNPLQNSSKRTVYVNSNDPSLCEICLKTWPAKKHLWQHYIRCHKTVAATVCGICLKTNGNYRDLQTHLRENHPTLLHGQGFGSNFICRICGRYHNASSKLRLHMAIHENFDWTILDRSDNKKNEPSNGYMSEEPKLKWAHLNNHEGDEGINYESLIEQVECSSDSDNNSDVDAKSVDNSSTCDESDNETISEENSLESQMLQNMLIEKSVYKRCSKKIAKKDYTSSNSDDTSDTNQTLSDTEVEIIDNGNPKSSSDDDSSDYERDKVESPKAQNIFIREPEELDSAIRSISYEQEPDVYEQLSADVCDAYNHPQSLNQHEIQSAVDSIL